MLSHKLPKSSKIGAQYIGKSSASSAGERPSICLVQEKPLIFTSSSLTSIIRTHFFLQQWSGMINSLAFPGRVHVALDKQCTTEARIICASRGTSMSNNPTT